MFAQSLAHFAIRLMFGISLMLSLLPRREVTSGFFRIQMLLLLGLGVLFALSSDGSRVGPIAISLLAFLGSVLWTLERRVAGSAAILLIMFASLAELALCAHRICGEGMESFVVYLLSDIATAGILGGAMTGMLLGHWYLTAPGMSLSPLVRMNAQLGAAAVFRLVISATALVAAGAQITGGIGWTGTSWTQTHWMWIGLRWLAGIGGPLAVFVMVRQILKYRNTQAATGVLFVGVILTYIGELTADLLFFELHRPL